MKRNARVTPATSALAASRPGSAATPARAVARAGLACALALGFLAATADAGAATFTVNSTSDIDPAGDSSPGDGVCEDARSGSRCTLRAAIEEANARAGLDTIGFSVAGSIVLLGTPLPAISEAVVLNGRTAPGFTSNGSLAGSPPVVTLDGGLLSGSPYGLTVRGADAAISDVFALSIVNFAGGGVRTMNDADGLWLQGCYVGVRPDGTAAGNGIGLSLVSDDNLVGQLGLAGFGTGIGNVVSSSTSVGILVAGTGNMLRGNMVGVRADGTGDRGNGDDGIQLLGSGHLVGDARVGSGNRISHNAGDGIYVASSSSRILGNDVGVAGTARVGNDGNGIWVTGDDNEIGGPTTAARNNVHGHQLANIRVGGSTASVAADRTLVMNNATHAGDFGIYVYAGADVRVLDNQAGDNVHDGIFVGFGVPRTSVAGNLVGFVPHTDDNVFIASNGGDGIEAVGDDGLIGIDTSGGSNTIRGNVVGFSGGPGIAVSGNRNRVQGNFVGVTNRWLAIPNQNGGIEVYGGGDSNAGLYNNYVGGNEGTGIRVFGNGARLCGNYIGTNAGFIDLTNTGDGVYVNGDGNHVGKGCTGNVIGFHNVGGILVAGDFNQVADNWVGVSPGGSDIGNAGAGISLIGGNQDTLVAGNRIGYNNGVGIAVRASVGERNVLAPNQFVRNGGIPIDLGDDGDTTNDAGDGDTGPNRLQNHPAVEFANVVADAVQVTWRVDGSAANAAFPLAVDFYLDGGDGAIDFLGRLSYATPFVLQVGELPLPGGTTGGLLYAMATDASGNSSELSAPRGVGLPQALFEDGFEQP